MSKHWVTPEQILEILIEAANASIYRFIDHRIMTGEYRPDERECRFAEMKAFLEKLEYEHLDGNKLQ